MTELEHLRTAERWNRLAAAANDTAGIVGIAVAVAILAGAHGQAIAAAICWAGMSAASECALWRAERHIVWLRRSKEQS